MGRYTAPCPIPERNGPALRELPLHGILVLMVRRTLGAFLVLALSMSWAAPVFARPEAPSHACCMGGDAHKAPAKGAPACCRPSEGLPPVVAAAPTAPAPALLSSVALAAEPAAVTWLPPARRASASPQAPPGTHSGLSPPASGL